MYFYHSLVEKILPFMITPTMYNIKYIVLNSKKENGFDSTFVILIIL